jgi:hypothetical protein
VRVVQRTGFLRRFENRSIQFLPSAANRPGLRPLHPGGRQRYFNHDIQRAGSDFPAVVEIKKEEPAMRKIFALLILSILFYGCQINFSNPAYSILAPEDTTAEAGSLPELEFPTVPDLDSMLNDSL